MKRYIYFFLLTASITVAATCLAQSPEHYLYSAPLQAGSKPPVSFGSIKKYIEEFRSVKLERAQITRDGHYCSYWKDDGVMLLSTTPGAWQQQLKEGQSGFFSGNNRHYIYQQKDSLLFFPLGGGEPEVIKGVASYQLLSHKGRNEWMAIRLLDGGCILKNLLTSKERRFGDITTSSFARAEWFGCLNRSGELVIVRLSTGKSFRYQHVTAYNLDGPGRAVFIKTAQGDTRSWLWVTLPEGKIHTVWQSKDPAQQPGAYALDNTAARLVFLVQNTKQGKTTSAIWYYAKGMKQAEPRVDENTPGLEAGMEISGDPSFSGNGSHILFNLVKTPAAKQKPMADAVQVNVWHYKDPFLQSAQVSKRKHPDLERWLAPVNYPAAIGTVGGSKVMRLTSEGESVRGVGGDYAVISSQTINGRYWEYNPTYSLLFLQDGRRIPLKKEVDVEGILKDWLLLWNKVTAQYIRYDIASDTYTNLSASASEFLGWESAFSFPKRRDTTAPASYSRLWLQGGEALLVYDYYDIWQLDLSGKKPAINLTGGYGRKHRIRFDIIPEADDETSSGEIRKDARLLLAAVNMETKENGFYTLQLGQGAREPQQLCMENALIYVGRSAYGHLTGGNMKPIKARDSQVWLIKKETATEPPNLYVTRDLRTFRRLSNVQPQQDCNGYRTELIDYRQQDGTPGKGILYKPEDFDVNKKYPVIIHYYQFESIRLNEYHLPGSFRSAHINIPWFVSRGYLVFVPDIYYTKESSGAAALNAVEGAATWLAAKPYVDSTRMGIAGHSRAGFMTNYILTHSSRFAAVFEGAGGSDWVSAELSLTLAVGMPRMANILGDVDGDMIWRNGSRYLESPILHVHKVTSPVLMFHCKNDGAVPFEQAIELFTALWRLGKKAWLLEYDEGSHTLLKSKDTYDLTVRVTQFFDHYLKGAPPPKWMTQGIPATMKGVETGLKQDTTGSKP